MSDDSDTDSTGSKSYIEQELAEAVVRAQKSLNRHANLRKQLASNGVDPDNHPRIKKAYQQVDVATLSAFDMMRHYARTEMDGYWNRRVVCEYNGSPVLFGSEPAKEIKNGEVAYATQYELPDDPQFLSDFYNRVEKNVRTEHKRFRGQEVHVDVRPVLLPINGYRTTVQLLMDVLKGADFAPTPPAPEYEADEPL